jgi:hypothetical protein
MKDRWTQGNNPRQVVRRGCSRLLGLLVTALVLVTVTAQGGPLITYSSPTEFFTNVAEWLLRSELDPLNVDLSNIQVYPTNQYTPAAHRILQVAANLYDSTTNRTQGLTPEYPYCPSVFRPLFRRVGSGTNSSIVIAGYREVVGTSMATPRLAPLMIELDGPNPLLTSFPPYGAAFSSLDKNEPMVSGIPLIIGARKGFPNFNELAMQTRISVSRLLEFRRAAGNPQTSPVIQTNQMYVMGVSNSFGLEAWNSYLTDYPRDLQLIASASITAIMTNELGGANVLFSNRVFQAILTNIPAGSWPGWNNTASASSSMMLPFGTTNGFNFVPNSTVLDQPPWFEPQTHIFPIATRGAFYVPHWWLNLNTRLLFILVDTQANRIVDYVNLNNWEPTLDITAKLQEGNSGGINALDYKNPANEWLTNRVGNSTSPDTATFGVINQILVGINGTIDLLNYNLDPASGLDAQSAVDGFRYNLLGLSPIYPKDFGKTFYKSNVFYAPFDPYRPIYIHTSWQANDPLVHFLPDDLIDIGMGESNRVDFLSQNPPLDNLGRINRRYRPWGGNPLSLDPATDYQVAIKDPGTYQSESWNFPTNQSLGVDWVGRVHRGTPWQTIFLKSTNILLQTGNPGLGLQNWALWTGDGVVYPLEPGPTGPHAFVFDAFFTAPTNDWHLVSTLNVLFNTNSVQQLTSVNQKSVQSWEGLLDGMTVLTNVSRTELDPLTMSSNSPQAAIIAQAILQNRSSEPDQLFHNIGDILATPELSVASPWLNLTNLMTDEALEVIPSQLLPLLRPDSIASATFAAPAPAIQFTGMDGYSYAIQVSSNLLDWTTLATNTPLNGLFIFFPPHSGVSAQFYRSKLLP